MVVAEPFVTAPRCAALHRKSTPYGDGHVPEHRPNAPTKNPAEAGFTCRAAGPAFVASRYLLGPRCDIRSAAIMKLSKRFSATWNHEISSLRNAFHGSYTFLNFAFLLAISS